MGGAHGLNHTGQEEYMSILFLPWPFLEKQTMVLLIPVVIIFVCHVVWLPHLTLCGPSSKEQVEDIGTNQENLEDAGDGS